MHNTKPSKEIVDKVLSAISKALEEYNNLEKGNDKDDSK